MTNFAFLETEWPSLYEAAEKASNAVYPDIKRSLNKKE